MEKWKPKELEVYEDWIEKLILLNIKKNKLSEWEMTFLESIQSRIYSGTNLTQAQAEKLENIYADKTR